MMQQALNKPKDERSSLSNKFRSNSMKKARNYQQSDSWDEMEDSERTNTISTLDLFRYAKLREQIAISVGFAFMIYAASWQPISVFILAIMASLMGQYSKQTSWLRQLNTSAEIGTPAASQLNLTIAGQPIFNPVVPPVPAADVANTYQDYSFLDSLHSFVTPLFELGSTTLGSQSKAEEEHRIREAVNDILEHESNQFLRKSFEINGSAFLLALTQLLAFFVGMTLITWAAKRQASRIKILYFDSCLHQEVTWFEAIDNAGGSGSSLNGLVEKYEDGIGMKLALLCYATHDELMRAGSTGDGPTMYKQLYEEQMKTMEKQRTETKSSETGASKKLLSDDGVSESSGSNEYEDDDCYDYDEDELEDDDSGTGLSGSVRSRPSAWQLWQFIEMPKWSALAATCICLLAGLILPLNLIAHSYLFSVFAYNELDQIGEYLQVFGLLILSFSTFVFIVSFLQVILPGYVGEKLSIRLRIKIMDALLQKPMFYFDMDSNSAGSLCNRFNTYISNLQNIAGTRVATMLEAISTLLAGAFFGFGQNLPLSLFCLSFALLVLFTTIVESHLVGKESSMQQKYDAQMAHLMADALSNIKTIASLNKEQFFIQRFSGIIMQRERGSGRSVALIRTFLTSLKFVMPAMSWSASMYYGCHLLTQDRIDLQTIFIVCPVVLFAVNDTFRALVFLPELLKARQSIKHLYKLYREFSPDVLQTLTLGQQLEEQNRLHMEQLAVATSQPSNLGAVTVTSRPPSGLLALPGTEGADTQVRRPSSSNRSISFVLEPPIMEIDPTDPPIEQVNRRLSNISALPSYMRRKSSRLNSLVPYSSARGRIDFKEVEFAYPNRPTAIVLDGFSLSIAPGESVALVGTSGSGKSTTVSILEKFYDYHAGKVTLDGYDLRLVEPRWVRSQIGLVSQEPCLLSYTIGDNIRYGDNGRFVSMDEVVEAARTANIHDFIMSLPDGYDTELSGSAYSSGCQLSGGQRQRIAIARALIRNAPILIFDEATSALDNRNETIVQDALNKARRGRTSLTIAHRLATTKHSDKIVVMRKGKVVEQGKHEELLKRPNGYYRSLWEQQEGWS